MNIATHQFNFDSTSGASPQFESTQWSLIRRAGLDSPQAREALETLCRTYWYPIYAFIRRYGRAPHDAQDLTQEFFARLLESNSMARANPRLGKFRTFLLGALKHFLADAHRKASAWKRGGGIAILSLDEARAEEHYQLEPVDDRTPDKIFEHKWPLAILETALTRMHEEFRAAGKERQFQTLKVFLSREGDDEAYEQAGAELDTTGKTIAVAVHRIRRRFRQVVRSAIAETVSTPGEVEEEYQCLFA